MRYLVTGKQMKAVDRHATEEIGIPSVVLMERAALAIVCEVEKLVCDRGRCLVMCGPGNNGADGIAAARMLFLKGWPVTVTLVGEAESDTKEFCLQRDIALKLGIPVIEFKDFLPGYCDVIVDAVFGVGLSRPVEGEYRRALQFIAKADSKIVAVDIPSGIHADTGAVMGVATRADVTVTFGYEKLGTALYPGRDFCGRLVIADIGFPAASLAAVCPETCTYEADDAKQIPKRRAYSNKGTFGKVLIVAGSRNMSGAAYLSALAAYRTGAGLVKILTVEENREILQTQLPEAIIETYDASQAETDRESFVCFIERQCAWAGIIVLGPGLGRGPYVESLVEAVLTNAYVPIILDADGLNAAASQPGLTNYFTENIVVTPHLGEMARLSGRTIQEIQADTLGSAREYSSRFGITVILKDAATVVARKDGFNYVNKSGCSAMAKAGSGDVLTGALAGLLAMGMDENEAVFMGVYLHGLAGEQAAKTKGDNGVLAGELADALASAAVCIQATGGMD